MLKTGIIDSDDTGAVINLSRPVRLFLNKFVSVTAYTSVNSYLNDKYGWKTPYTVSRIIDDDPDGCIAMLWNEWGYLRDALNDFVGNPFMTVSARKNAITVMAIIERADKEQAER